METSNKRPTRRPWTTAEVELLKLHYPRGGARACTELLAGGRTICAINNLASRLNVRLAPELRSAVMARNGALCGGHRPGPAPISEALYYGGDRFRETALGRAMGRIDRLTRQRLNESAEPLTEFRGPA